MNKKIEADIAKRFKKLPPFDPEKLKALNDKIEVDSTINDATNDDDN